MQKHPQQLKKLYHLYSQNGLRHKVIHLFFIVYNMLKLTYFAGEWKARIHVWTKDDYPELGHFGHAALEIASM